MLYERAFITGCDSNTFWQLKWFVKNYREHADTPLVIANFGMSEEEKDQAIKWSDGLVEVNRKLRKGWFGKARAMLAAPVKNQLVWLDTDCEVCKNPYNIFNYINEQKLYMVPDKPWNKRRPGSVPWFNTGVIGMKGKPQLLHNWMHQCENGGDVGDQETLFRMMVQNPLMNHFDVEALPAQYNVLRLDFEDGEHLKLPEGSIVIKHWTGAKGNEIIKGKMKNAA